VNPTEIEFAVKALVAKPYDPATFVFDLIAIYNTPKVTVSKLKSGQTNGSKVSGDILWKKHLYFRAALPTDDVATVADNLAHDALTNKDNPRFIFVTNGEQVHIRDRQLDDTCNAEFRLLDESFDFLLPLAGYERRAVATENLADRTAAKRLSKLYDAIFSVNPSWSDGNHAHELNLFMTRILFCFYAENTGIFTIRKIFTDTIAQHTSEDGSDVAPLLDRLFIAMNTRLHERSQTISVVVNRFPYVNGSLFEQALQIPKFNRTARRLFLECGELDWQNINPDIFGSMIQTIAHPGARGELGMHYTSVPNIMKVLQPLFIDNVNEAYEKANASVPKLDALLARLSTIRVFDPACGCGNFLVIAYKELRQIEMRILGRIGELAPDNPLRLTGISLQNFFGIDIVDFACETAKLSLWIAEYQMNSAFRELFGTARPPLPLGKIGTIHNGNSLRMDWLTVCPGDSGSETYICGNPPYQGSVGQTMEQKSDITAIFMPILRAYKDVDYVSCWFIKLSEYIAATLKTAGALVATKSVCQGEQVAFLWPHIFGQNVCISFAHTSFKWSNNASHNAGVTCIIVGLCKATTQLKRLFTESHHIDVPNINAYLVPSSSNLIVAKTTKPLNNLPATVLGNKPSDGGHLILSTSERRQLLDEYPTAAPLIRKFLSNKDFTYNLDRYVLWISDDQLPLARAIPPIASRLRKISEIRKEGGSQARDVAGTPHRFAYISYRSENALIIPEISSERRSYLQIGLLGPLEIANNKLYLVYEPPSYLLALLSSRVHRIWTTTIGSHFRMDLSYSASLVYNTFPVPNLSDEQKRILADHSKNIIKARARHPGKTVAWFYNPETMPANLLEAHQDSDIYLEKYVYGRTFKDDTHRLEHLFAMYATMKAREATPLLAANVQKPKKART
jgi:hypothetical protein